MNSEKVKEIKYYLEQSAYMYGNMQKQALILINELESENERLNECYKVKAYDKLRAENKQLKDRIAELEKENKDYYDRLNNAQTYIDNHEEVWKSNTKIQLKQFAERLKEKLKEKVNADNVDGFVECSKLISETLKDFMGEK